MAIIPQESLFQWEELESLGDLERLRLVIEHLPDEKLMLHLESDRKNRRDDYPIRAMWNALLAGVVFGHPSIQSLRRELARNAQLRIMCGFKFARGDNAVPEAYVFTRFLKKLIEHQEMIDELFNKLVHQLQEILPDFGKVLAMDGKAIETHANPRKEDAPQTPDGRRDLDATHGRKTMRERGKGGKLYEKIFDWFGYKLMLIVDATYELPVAYEVSKAHEHETPVGERLLEKTAQQSPELLATCQALAADKGFDSESLITRLWNIHQIAAIIPTRWMWKDGEKTRLVDGTRNVVYDQKGRVYCCCMKTGEFRKMANGGFEKDRMCQKYLCPAEHYGTDCPAKGNCHVNKAVRIKLDINRRIFTPVARDSLKFERLYAMRTSVERVNSRLDVSFGFEQHFIRGQAKMKLCCGLSLLVMLTMALGRVKEKQPELMRSLVKAA